MPNPQNDAVRRARCAVREAVRKPESSPSPLSVSRLDVHRTHTRLLLLSLSCLTVAHSAM